MIALVEKLLGWIWSGFSDRRRLRLTVHLACFQGSDLPYCFINATNLSRNRDVEITHVWIDCEPKIHVINPSRPLPKRLKPDETWATWIELSRIPTISQENPYTLARAKLSSGSVVKSTKNENVPEEGTVPGGTI